MSDDYLVEILNQKINKVEIASVGTTRYFDYVHGQLSARVRIAL